MTSFQKVEIPFVEVKNHFVNSTYRDADSEIKVLVVENIEQFNGIFGKAHVMGEGGQPTFVDFTSQYALAIINPPSDKVIEQTPTKLEHHTAINQLCLHLHHKISHESQSYISQVASIIAINSQFKGNVVINSIGFEIPFFELNHYFIKNTYKDADQEMTLLRIDNEEHFNQIFGMARTMGTDGIPSKIDFVSHDVIAVINPPSDKAISQVPMKVECNSFLKKLHIHVQRNESNVGQSFTTQVATLIAIPKVYSGELHLILC